LGTGDGIVGNTPFADIHPERGFRAKRKLSPSGSLRSKVELRLAPMLLVGEAHIHHRRFLREIDCASAADIALIPRLIRGRPDGKRSRHNVTAPHSCRIRASSRFSRTAVSTAIKRCQFNRGSPPVKPIVSVAGSISPTQSAISSRNPAIIDLPRRLRTHQAIMIATLSDQERIVLRGATIQHPQSPRAGIEADEIAVAKMPEAGAEPYRDRETLAFAGREMLPEENRHL
jgi:hypothetical protein